MGLYKSILYLSITLAPTINGCSTFTNGEKETAKNAIFLIGDGMGPAQITAGRLYAYGSKGSLHMERMKYSGISKTFSSNEFTTDSAAAATALASGVKTYNGSIGKTDSMVDPTHRSRDLQTLFDIAKRAGKSLGLVTTTRVTHATPGAFYAHAKSRKEESSIAEQLFDYAPDLILGGGRGFFLPKKTHSKTGMRKDGRNLIQEFKNKGYDYIDDKTSLSHLDLTNGKKVIGLFASSDMNYEVDRKGSSEPSLSEMTSFAIKKLSQNPKGYFLVIEGARIDHAAHNNQGRRTLGDVVAFDHSIGLALDHQKGETLIVVTADHETGGMAINGYGSLDSVKGKGLFKNRVLDKTKPLLNRGVISWGTGPGYHSNYEARPSDPLHREKAAYYMPIAAHTAVDVSILADGPGSINFTGFMNNSEIPKKIAKALGLSFDAPPNLDGFSSQTSW